VQKALSQHNTDPSTIRGIGFDATCSLAVFLHDTDEPTPVTGPSFSNDGNDCNVILWLDHRSAAEANMINLTGHHLLRFVGGQMNEEKMEIQKILWLKLNILEELFGHCKFYDLVDPWRMATGTETRNFYITVHERGHVSVGLDGAIKGWQEDFYECLGLEELIKDNFKRIGGVNKVIHLSLIILSKCESC
jgi:ribulose kinase